MTVKNSLPTRVQQKLKDILAVLDETGKPYFITQRNRPKAVVIRYEDYSAWSNKPGRGERASSVGLRSVGASRSSRERAFLCATSSSASGPANQ